MAEVAISELSKLTGFPSSALRYYERIGLLSPVGRSSGGYRLYDERAVERLTFIARAKRLGLNLDEITDLVALWEDGACGPVQTRLRVLVDDKVECLDAQIDELARFRSQLEHVQRSLASAEPTDRCGPGCGCDTELPTEGVVPIAFGRRDARLTDGSADTIACTLVAGDAEARMQEWQALLARVEERRSAPSGVGLRFARDPDVVSSVAALTAREVDCCSFLTFTLTLDAHAAWLTISAPPEAKDLVIELFGGTDD